MDKYGIQNEDLVKGLRDEEASLMREVAHHMSVGQKTAAQEREFSTIQNRLTSVRDKISEFDLSAKSAPKKSKKK
jgi:hypothetical protein